MRVCVYACVRVPVCYNVCTCVHDIVCLHVFGLSHCIASPDGQIQECENEVNACNCVLRYVCASAWFNVYECACMRACVVCVCEYVRWHVCARGWIVCHCVSVCVCRSFMSR